MNTKEKNPLWTDNSVQFPRLLAEISAVIPRETVEEVGESMDLEPAEVYALFSRAETEWEKIKEKYCPK